MQPFYFLQREELTQGTSGCRIEKYANLNRKRGSGHQAQNRTGRKQRKEVQDWRSTTGCSKPDRKSRFSAHLS